MSVEVMLIKSKPGSVFNVLSHKDFADLLREELGSDAADYFEREARAEDEDNEQQWLCDLAEELRQIDVRKLSPAKMENKLEKLYRTVCEHLGVRLV